MVEKKKSTEQAEVAIPQQPYIGQYPPNYMADDEIDLVELFKTLFRYWKMIIIIVVLATLGTAIYSMFIPPTYTANTKFFIPEEEGQPSYMSTLNTLGLGNIVGGGGTSTEIVVNLLNSRRMAKDIIQKFKLLEYYSNNKKADKKQNTNPAAQLESVINTVKANLSVNKDKTNFITLSFSDRNPKKAAEITNFFVVNLDRINEELQITSQKPIVKILDKADVPVIKSKPNKKMMVIISFITSGIFAVFLAFAFEYITNILKEK